MTRTPWVLLFSGLLLAGAGWFVYQLGSQMNLEVENEGQHLWVQGPGDVWLYVGGLIMMLLSGSLFVAAFLFWKGSRAEIKHSSRHNLANH